MLDLLCRPLPFNSVAVASGAISNVGNVGGDRLGRAALIPSGISSFDVDLGASVSVDTFALLAGSFGTSDSWSVVGAATQAGLTSTQLFNSGALTALASPEGLGRVHRQALHVRTATSVRWIRISVNVAAAMPIGRVVIGKRFEPLEGRDYGWAQRVLDLGELQRSRQGLESAIIRGKVQEFSWRWSGLSRDEAENQALELMAYAGVTRDLLWCGDHTAANRHNLLGFGKMAEPAVTENYAEGWYNLDCQLQSRLILAL